MTIVTYSLIFIAFAIGPIILDEPVLYDVIMSDHKIL